MSDRQVRALAAFLVFVLVAGMPASAGSISIAWDPVSHPALAGYRVHYGTATGSYSQQLNAQLSTSAVLEGLADCTMHYIAVKSYNGEGTQSTTFSNEVVGWPRPVLASASPTELARGTQVALTINGTNFRPGSTLQINAPGVSIQSATVESCQRIVAVVAVSGSAPLGASTLTVSHPDGAAGSLLNLVAVVADSTAPAITELAPGAVGATTATISWVTNEAASSQLHYRTAGQSSYQASPVSPAMVTDHAVALHGLFPATSYEYYARSVDAAGNAISSAVQTFTTLASSYSYLRVEPELGQIGAPIAVVTGAGAFRGAWVALPQGASGGNSANPNGVVTLGFQTEDAGEWRVWMRVYGPSTASDGWFEKVDNATYNPIQPSAVGTWEWVAGRSYDLNPGQHTLRLGGREALARIDRILITDDPNFTPSEIPADDVTAPSGVSSLAAAASDGSITLSWTDPTDADAARLVIRYRPDGVWPTTPVDGLPLVDTPVEHGDAGLYEHSGLVNGTNYRYSVFTVDAAGNVSVPATVESAPSAAPPDPVTNLRRADVL